MRRLAAALFVPGALFVASSAFAVDLSHKTAAPPSAQAGFMFTAARQCDNGVAFSALYQRDSARFGNVFHFGSGFYLSQIEFAHHGYGFAGPYRYDVELWDPASCTLIASIDGFTAADAATANRVERPVLGCRRVTGDVLVAIDANTCLDSTDCYPDLLFDNQMFVACPWVAEPSAGVCYPIDSEVGPFLLRVLDPCVPSETRKAAWGEVKQLYR